MNVPCAVDNAEGIIEKEPRSNSTLGEDYYNEIFVGIAKAIYLPN